MYINMHGDVKTHIMGCEAMNTFEHLNIKHTESGLVFLVWSEVSMIELNQYHASEYIKIIAYDSCKQILNSLQTIEVNLRSTAPNRQSICTRYFV